MWQVNEVPTQTASWEVGMRSAGPGEQMPVEMGPGEAAAGGKAGISFDGACT